MSFREVCVNKYTVFFYFLIKIHLFILAQEQEIVEINDSASVVSASSSSSSSSNLPLSKYILPHFDTQAKNSFSNEPISSKVFLKSANVGLNAPPQIEEMGK